jgi:pimeloyl-ACP methyl ester carboxylesterase
MATDSPEKLRCPYPVRRVELSGTHWEYCAAGRGPRGLLVLGGLLSFADSSHRLMRLFEPSRRVVAPSYPSCSSAAEVADGIARLLDLEGLFAVDVYGHALGAGIAHLFVRRYPQRVRRIALSGFGLTTPFRVAANRALLEMFQLLPHGAVHAHFMRLFARQAGAAHDRARAEAVLREGEALLARHSHASALHHLRLQLDLFRENDAYGLSRPAPHRALLVLPDDDPAYLRQEQDNLERTYRSPHVFRRPLQTVQMKPMLMSFLSAKSPSTSTSWLGEEAAPV